jgi:hypothetical protein
MNKQDTMAPGKKDRIGPVAPSYHAATIQRTVTRLSAIAAYKSGLRTPVRLEFQGRLSQHWGKFG